MSLSLWIGAAVGALVASIVNGVFNWLIKRGELRVQRLGIALKCAELKHQQIVVSQEWAFKQNAPQPVAHWDPLVSVIDYMNGMEEFEKTGHWMKGQRETPK